MAFLHSSFILVSPYLTSPSALGLPTEIYLWFLHQHSWCGGKTAPKVACWGYVQWAEKACSLRLPSRVRPHISCLALLFYPQSAYTSSSWVMFQCLFGILSEDILSTCSLHFSLYLLAFPAIDCTGNSSRIWSFLILPSLVQPLMDLRKFIVDDPIFLICFTLNTQHSDS